MCASLSAGQDYSPFRGPLLRVLKWWLLFELLLLHNNNLFPLVPLGLFKSHQNCKKKKMILEWGQEMCKMSLEHFAVPENKEVSINIRQTNKSHIDESMSKGAN